jgi:lipoprotein-releasing system ATP-binding protein
MQISVNNLCKTYHKSLDKAKRVVLEGLNLDVPAGQKIAIMGPSGSGKTTLLKLLGTLDTPDSGQIVLGERDISALQSYEILKIRNREIGFVFQFHNLLPQLTLWENVLLPVLPRKEAKEESYRHASELLKLMGLYDYRNSKPDELSGGECQRAAVARALINRPGLLLADEPTGSLDQNNALMLMDLLIKINREMKVTLIIATHSAEIASLMDRIYSIRDGKLQSIASESFTK